MARTRRNVLVHHNVDHPVSLYAATKKANELMAHTYSHLYQLPTTGLRFFTVYGPWGRPDMALYLFTKAITEGRPIDVFNHGKMRRDFTYVDDIVEALVRLIDLIPLPMANGMTLIQTRKRTVPLSRLQYRQQSNGRACAFHPVLEQCLGREQRKTTCHCNLVMCWRPMPMSATWKRPSVFDLQQALKRVLQSSLHGTKRITLPRNACRCTRPLTWLRPPSFHRLRIVVQSVGKTVESSKRCASLARIPHPERAHDQYLAKQHDGL